MENNISTLVGEYWDRIKALISNKKQGDSQNYCDCLVFNKDGNLLILERTKLDDFQPGKWCLPGGKQEGEELLIEACVRELAEETNIVFNLFTDSIQPINSIKNPDNSISHYFFIVLSEYVIPVLDTEEHVNFKWIPLSDIPTYDFIFDLGQRIENSIDDYIANSLSKSVDAMSLSNEYDLLDNDKISLDEFFLFEKANQSSFTNDPSHGGRLVKYQFTDKSGRNQTKWITKKAMSDMSSSGTQESEQKTSRGQVSEEKLIEFAKDTPINQLEKFVKKTKNRKLKQVALTEIKRRENE